MADEAPSKNDINAIFKRLRSISTNKCCYDCRAKNPTWASVTYGVFICIDCSAIHRSLGVHVSFVKSTQLDTNWTWIQIRGMQVGGNANAEAFFLQHNCTTTDGQQKYTSRAAQLYREKLHQAAVQAIRIHGTKIFLDTDHAERPASPEQKDFFDETEMMMARMNVQDEDIALHPRPARNGAVTSPDQDLEGPSVDSVLSTSPTEALKSAESRKPTIGQRKAPPAKKGMGAKKGLGAQKVRTNFSELEREAEMHDRLREETIAEEKLKVQRTQEDDAKQLASIRLAYQDLDKQKQKEEEKLKQSDPKKAAQLERLGMGFGSRSSGVAHSAMGDMKTIEQDTPNSTGSSSVYKDARDFFEDDFEIISFSSGPPKYRDSPFGGGDRYGKSEDRFSSKKTSSWDTEKPESKSSFFDEMIISKESEDSTRRKPSLPTPTSSAEAVKKFGNAKSISSEQYFGNSRDMDYERRANLTRFEGSSSISSADYFGDGSSSRNNPQPSFNAPDMEDIREGVRAGVTKVAGKLSNLANGVMSSLQRK